MIDEFIGDPLKPDTATFDADRMAAGGPGLPSRFVWRGDTMPGGGRSVYAPGVPFAPVFSPSKVHRGPGPRHSKNGHRSLLSSITWQQSR